MKTKVLVILFLLTASTLRQALSAVQTLGANYICAPGFGGNGFQDNSDADVGVVRVHVTLSGQVADGRYNIHVNTGVGLGADPFVDIAGGQITYGQDSLVFAEDGFSIGVGNTTPSMSITPNQA